MKLKIVKPDGSLMFYPKIRGIVESEDGSLILLHEDYSERVISPTDWVGFEAAKSAIGREGKIHP